MRYSFQRTAGRFAIALVLLVLAQAGPARGAIACVDGIGTASGTTTSNALAVTTTTAVAAGDSIIVGCAMDNVAGTVSCTGAGGTTFRVLLPVAGPPDGGPDALKA